MKTKSDDPGGNDLEALFAMARQQTPQAEDAFMARVLADAMAAQPVPAVAGARKGRLGVLQRFAAVLGGATALAGIGSAAMAGLLIGYVQPEPMLTFAQTMGFGSVESLDLTSGFDTLLTEDLSQ